MNKILKEFDSIVKAPKVLEQLEGQSCPFCGGPSDKGPQVKRLKDFLIKSLKAYALSKVPNEKREDEFENFEDEIIGGKDAVKDIVLGYNFCREEMINNINDEKELTSNN